MLGCIWILSKCKSAFGLQTEAVCLSTLPVTRLNGVSLFFGCLAISAHACKIVGFHLLSECLVMYQYFICKLLQQVDLDISAKRLKNKYCLPENLTP